MTASFGIYDLMSVVSYSLTALSYTMREMVWLRVITVIGSAIDIVVFYFIRPGEPLWVQILFNILIFAINAYQLFLLWRERTTRDFTGDDSFLYRTTFSFLAPSEFRRLLKIGERMSLASGQQLIAHGQASDQVAVVITGSLAVSLNGEAIAQVPPGGFAGEMSFMTGRPTSADACAEGPTRLFVLQREALAQLMQQHPELKAKLEGAWGRILADRLRQLTNKLGHQAEPPRGVLGGLMA